MWNYYEESQQYSEGTDTLKRISKLLVLSFQQVSDISEINYHSQEERLP